MLVLSSIVLTSILEIMSFNQNIPEEVSFATALLLWDMAVTSYVYTSTLLNQGETPLCTREVVAE